MKTFPVTSIHTTDDGRVILSGPLGSLDIRRNDTGSVVQRYRVGYHVTHADNHAGTHSARVYDLPRVKKSTISVGLAF